MPEPVVILATTDDQGDAVALSSYQFGHLDAIGVFFDPEPEAGTTVSVDLLISGEVISVFTGLDLSETDTWLYPRGAAVDLTGAAFEPDDPVKLPVAGPIRVTIATGGDTKTTKVIAIVS